MDPSDLSMGGEDSQIPEDHILRWDSFEGRRKPAEGKRIGEVSSTWAQAVFSMLQKGLWPFNPNLQIFEVVIMANSWSVPQIECHGCKRECHIRDTERYRKDQKNIRHATWKAFLSPCILDQLCKNNYVIDL